MVLTEESNILNLDYHIKVLTLRALNNSDTIREAAGQLGITTRTLYHYINRFRIKKRDCGEYLNRYYAEEKKLKFAI